MGYPEDYDKVYDIKDTITLLHILYKNREESTEIVPEDLVVNLHVNMTHDQKHLGGFELEDEQINRVKTLYETDYRRGWHGN